MYFPVSRIQIRCLSDALFSVAPRDGKVLVLGSGGLIGSAVVSRLQRSGFDVLEVQNRTHLDLRQTGSLDVFE